jgi:probable HAF family extracellular repeat protein
LAALVLSPSPGVFADAIYTVVDLGPSSLAHLNDAGQVAWTVAPFPGTNTARSFLYSGYGPDAGRVEVIPGSYTTVSAINGSGQVLGTLFEGGTSRAFVYDGGEARDIGTLGGRNTYATRINAAGQVAGTSETADGSQRAFLYRGGQLHDLGTLGGRESSVSDLNDRGQVTGSSRTANGEAHGFLYSGGRMHDLGTLGGTYGSYPTDINALGQVVGLSETASGESHTFLYSGGRIHDLGAPPRRDRLLAGRHQRRGPGPGPGARELFRLRRPLQRRPVPGPDPRGRAPAMRPPSMPRDRPWARPRSRTGRPTPSCSATGRCTTSTR